MKKWFTKGYWLETFPLYKALLWIFTITCLISGTAFVALTYYRYLQEMRTSASKFNITTVVAQARSGPELPVAYLIELLQLSSDQPTNLYNWNAKAAEKLLKESPYIRKAAITKMPPDTVLISYSSHVPVASIGDWSGALLDKDGYIIPEHPLIASEKFPKIILGLESIRWGEKLFSPESWVALRLKNLIEKQFGKDHLLSIDVSKAFSRSAGKRQIVVTLDYEGATHFLRITESNYLQQLANYREILDAKKMPEGQSFIIDLRLDHLAYLYPKEGS